MVGKIGEGDGGLVAAGESGSLAGRLWSLFQKCVRVPLDLFRISGIGST